MPHADIWNTYSMQKWDNCFYWHGDNTYRKLDHKYLSFLLLSRSAWLLDYTSEMSFGFTWDLVVHPVHSVQCIQYTGPDYPGRVFCHISALVIRILCIFFKYLQSTAVTYLSIGHLCQKYLYSALNEEFCQMLPRPGLAKSNQAKNTTSQIQIPSDLVCMSPQTITHVQHVPLCLPCLWSVLLLSRMTKIVPTCSIFVTHNR